MTSQGESTGPAVIFDLDGTLADTLDDITDTMNAVFAGAGLAPVTQAGMRALIGEGLSVLIGRASGIDDPARVEELVGRYRPEYGKRMLNRTRLYPGIAAMLDVLAERETKMCVLSNKPHAFTAPMCEALLSGWPFVRWMGHCDGGPRKPDPGGAMALAQVMGIDPAEMYFVGDSAIDVETGRNTGMRTIAVSWGFRERGELQAAGADHLVDSPDQIPPLVAAR